MVCLADPVALQNWSCKCYQGRWLLHGGSPIALYHSHSHSIVRMLQFRLLAMTHGHWPARRRLLVCFLRLCNSLGMLSVFGKMNDRLVNLDAFYTQWVNILYIHHDFHKDVFMCIIVVIKSEFEPFMKSFYFQKRMVLWVSDTFLMSNYLVKVIKSIESQYLAWNK